MKNTHKQLEEQNKEHTIFVKTLSMLDRYFFDIARKEHDQKLAKLFAAEEAKAKKEKEFLAARDDEELRNRHKAEAAAVAALKTADVKKDTPDSLFEHFVAAIEATVKKIALSATAGINAQLGAGVINQAQANQMHHFVSQHVAPLNHTDALQAIQAIFKRPVKDAQPELVDDMTEGAHESMHAHIRSTAASLCDPTRYSQDPLHYLREPNPDQHHPLKDMLILALMRHHGVAMQRNPHAVEKHDVLSKILFSSTKEHVSELAFNLHHSMKVVKVPHPTWQAVLGTGVFSTLRKGHHTAPEPAIRSLLDPAARLRKPKPTDD